MYLGKGLLYCLCVRNFTAILTSLHMCILQNICCAPLCTESPPDGKQVFAAKNSTIWPLEVKKYQGQILTPSIVAPAGSMISLIPTFFRY